MYFGPVGRPVHWESLGVKSGDLGGQGTRTRRPIYLLICSLFNDVFSVTSTMIVSNERVTG